MNLIVRAAASFSLASAFVGGLLCGCAEAPRGDLAFQAARLTGIDHAIVFHEGSHESRSTTQPAGATLGERQAVRLALEHDPRIQAALARVRVAEADTRQARLLPNPILNVDFRLPERGGPATVEIIPTEDVIAILQKPAQISAADNRLRESATEALTTVLDVVAQTQEAYAAAQSTDADIADAQTRLDITRHLYDLSQKRLDAGEGTRLDVLTLQAQRVQATTDLADLRLQRATARLTLTRLIGDPRGAATWQLDAPRATPPVRGEESAWIDAAIINRPEILSRVWELRALGDEVALADLSFLTPDQFGVYAAREPKWDIGPTASFPVPIFDFGQAAKPRAKAQVRAARYDLAQQCLLVIEDVRQAYATYSASQQALATARKELLPLQQQQQEQADAAYRNGDVDLATLLLAQNDLQATRAKILDLQEKVVVALVHLQRAAGGAGVAATVENAAPATQPISPAQTGPTP